MVELPVIHAQVLIALLQLLHADDARDTLAAALRKQRGGAKVWAAVAGHGGAVGSRRRRGADIFSSDLWVRALSWGRSLFRRVYSRESFCVSTWQYVSMSVGSV